MSFNKVEEEKEKYETVSDLLIIIKGNMDAIDSELKRLFPSERYVLEKVQTIRKVAEAIQQEIKINGTSIEEKK